MSPSSIPRKTFYMSRHGQTEDNARHIVSGTGAELSTEGEGQARALRSVVAAMWNKPAEQCYLVTSKISRARRTTGFGFPAIVPRLDHRLNEIDTGTGGGKVVAEELYEYGQDKLGIPKEQIEMSHFNGHMVNDLNGDPVKLDYAETNDQQRKRVKNALQDHLDKVPDNQDAVFVSHLLTMRRAAEVLELPFKDFKNATLYEFEPEGKAGWKLRECQLEQGQIKKTLIAQTNIPAVGSGSFIHPTM